MYSIYTNKYTYLIQFITYTILLIIIINYYLYLFKNNIFIDRN